VFGPARKLPRQHQLQQKREHILAGRAHHVVEGNSRGKREGRYQEVVDPVHKMEKAKCSRGAADGLTERDMAVKGTCSPGG
jgi:hypothetical protein